MIHLLFVEDRTKRIEWATQYYTAKGYTVTVACNVPEALRLMATRDWEIISLDHDLNGHDFENPDSPTCGMEIVRYIQKCTNGLGWPRPRSENQFYPPPPPKFFIHSTNMFAAHLMIMELSKMHFDVTYSPLQYD